MTVKNLTDEAAGTRNRDPQGTALVGSAVVCEGMKAVKKARELAGEATEESTRILRTSPHPLSKKQKETHFLGEWEREVGLQSGRGAAISFGC